MTLDKKKDKFLSVQGYKKSEDFPNTREEIKKVNVESCNIFCAVKRFTQGYQCSKVCLSDGF